MSPRPPGVSTAKIGWKGGSPDIRGLLGRMLQLRGAVTRAGSALLRGWRPQLRRPGYFASAANLAAYIGLRRHDLRALQGILATLGLSSLGRSEGHVRATLDAVIHALKRMTGARVARQEIARVALAMGRDQVLLQRHTNQLFGPPPAKRWTRFMVTLPTEAASDYAFVRELVRHGMDCARINCAHDAPEAWLKMIGHVRRAEQETGHNCKVMMDLAGPKLRTGPVALDQGIVHLRPERNTRGTITAPASVILDAGGQPGCNARKDGLGRRLPARLSVAADWLQRLSKDEHIKFTDLRGKEGVLLLTDMFGGTPSNLGLTFLEKDRIEVITGVNLPMLIKLAQLPQSQDLLAVARQMRDDGRNAIWVASDLLRGEKA